MYIMLCGFKEVTITCHIFCPFLFFSLFIGTCFYNGFFSSCVVCAHIYVSFLPLLKSFQFDFMNHFWCMIQVTRLTEEAQLTTPPPHSNKSYTIVH